MIDFDDALARVLATAEPCGDSEPVALDRALGCYLAEDVVASSPVPGFDNSAMDGYAVRVAEVQRDVALPVSQRVAAGDDPAPLAPNSVARIFTGAKLPEGADAIVLQEDTTAGPDGVVFTEMPRHGQHIRRAGESITAGSVIARQGERLTAALLGLLASTGVATPQCFKPLRVAFFSTGDELREPGEPLAGGQIYNSNRYTLAGCLNALGLQPVDLGCCPDNAQSTRQILQRASETADCMIAMGGMSVGEEDHVRRESEALGELQLWKIAMKPGKPFAAGTVAGVPFFGLPGNPVSSFVTFQLLVKPWLLKRLGAEYRPQQAQVRANFDWQNSGRRLDFLRARVAPAKDGVLQAEIYPQQGSGVMTSIAWANALLPVAPGQRIAPGDMVQIQWLDWPGHGITAG